MVCRCQCKCGVEAGTIREEIADALPSFPDTVASAKVRSPVFSFFRPTEHSVRCEFRLFREAVIEVGVCEPELQRSASKNPATLATLA